MRENTLNVSYTNYLVIKEEYHMLTLIALAVVIIALVAIRASARLVTIIITITTIVVLGTANAHAAEPGLGACGECTSNVVGLSVDYLAAAILLIISTVGTIILVRSDKKNK